MSSMPSKAARTCETYSFFGGKGGMIANDVVDRNADRESDTSADGAAVHLLLIQLCSLRFHYCVAEFA